MARLVFVAVFLAAVSAAADAQPLRYPFNGHIFNNGGGCLKLNNTFGWDDQRHYIFQTDIVEPAGADRVSVRFRVENRCQTAIRIMGGLRADGRTIQQRGPIEIHAVRVTAPPRYADGSHGGGESIGKGSLQSFVVPANGTVTVDGLVMLAAGAVPADVAVVAASPVLWGAYTKGGTEHVLVTLPPDSTVFCIHYADQRCGEDQ